MDFALILFVLMVATGVIWVLDHFLWAPGRRHADKAEHEPLVVEYARAFFPVIVVVFLLRSFVVEPFRIPSGSMLPNLLIGDFILVNKFAYGIRLPIINWKMIDLGSPKRGEVVVFRFPSEPSVNYIKRVIGIPGDRVLYKDKRLFINGEPAVLGDAKPYRDGRDMPGEISKLQETINGTSHAILISDRPDRVTEVTVPEGHYFVMGDNRDHSNDSRYWGYVPDQNLAGRAFLVWFSWDHSEQPQWPWQRVVWSRIGHSIK